MNLDQATISVIASGCVAIAAILAPVLISVFSDWLKWSHERKVVAGDRIEQTTQQLVDSFAVYMTGAVISTSSDQWRFSHADLQRLYYAWERSLWAHCNKAERKKIEELRTSLEGIDHNTLCDSAADLVHNVLALAYAVSNRIS